MPVKGGIQGKASAAYLATRACNSTGAPESTAAGTTSPGSLPSITRLGIGENVLHEGFSQITTMFADVKRLTYDVP